MSFYRSGQGARIPRKYKAVVPDDGDDGFLDQGCIELFCTAAGDLVVEMQADPDGTTTTIPSAIVSGYGNIITARIKKVWSTGTTATGIVAWFE